MNVDAIWTNKSLWSHNFQNDLNFNFYRYCMYKVFYLPMSESPKQLPNFTEEQKTTYFNFVICHVRAILLPFLTISSTWTMYQEKLYYYDFRIKTTIGSSLPPSCWWEGPCLICVVCVCLRVVVSVTYCVVFVVFFFILCTTCYQFLWIVLFWLLLPFNKRFFIWPLY